MGEEDDPQKLKGIAAASHDYENDPKWADYWSNILIPPHMASRPDVIQHFKRKFYQRYIDPDLVVEPMSTNTSSQPPKPSVAPSSSTPTNQTRQRSSGSTARASGTSPAPAPNTSSLRWDRPTIQFSITAWNNNGQKSQNGTGRVAKWGPYGKVAFCHFGCTSAVYFWQKIAKWRSAIVPRGVRAWICSNTILTQNAILSSSTPLYENIGPSFMRVGVNYDELRHMRRMWYKLTTYFL